MDKRRKEAASDETSLSEGLSRNVRLEGIVNFARTTGLAIDQILLDEKKARSENERQLFSKLSLGDATTPLEILKRTLSVRSVLSTHSSFAERMDALRHADPRRLKLAEIGRGSFGVVYEIPGTEWCLKKTLTAPEILWEEFANGLIISNNVNRGAWDAILANEDFQDALMPRVPRYLCSYGMEDGQSAERWFKNNGYMFPVDNGGQKPGPVICLERIMPLPKLIRENLIRLYFRPEKQKEALADKKNKACICRPYLGCTSQEIAADKRQRECETLQNFPLYLDILNELAMDPLTIATDMALGLAAGHWAANVNMLDVEYVIGSRPHAQQETAPLSKTDTKDITSSSTRRRVRDMTANVEDRGPSFRNRAIQLWMIDFNKIKTFNPSVVQDYDKTIQQLVFTTRSTDGPYYPRVLARNEEEWMLWLHFARTYIQASKVILQHQYDKVERCEGERKNKRKELVMKRPSRVMNEWMRAEASEYGVSSKEFMNNLERNKWDML